ncbi:MAG: AraC family transcriptional regulator [Chitinophagaceae bacterium]|nr:AraC family transcriptional regulator [Rubrivivax sp.]
MSRVPTEHDARHPALRDAVARHAPTDGASTSAIEGLVLYRYSQPTELPMALYEPSMCLLAQGAKSVCLGENVHHYGPMRHLVASQHLPAAGRVLNATLDAPYLCVCLAIDAVDVADLLLDIGSPPHPHGGGPAEGMYTEDTSPHLLDATLRLVQLLDHPRDAHALGRSLKREIVYRLLTAPSGWRLARCAASSSYDRRIGRVIAWLREHYRAPLRISDLASVGHMSESTLHQHFRAVTAMTPLQYQKKLRLLEARRLLLSASVDAATVGHTVGYESPSQFSREYARMFGDPPRRHQARLRAVTQQASAMA